MFKSALLLLIFNGVFIVNFEQVNVWWVGTVF